MSDNSDSSSQSNPNSEDDPEVIFKPVDKIPACQTKLFLALETKNIEEFTETLGHDDVDVNYGYCYPDRHNGTILHFACSWKGYVEYVKKLLQHNADINAKNTTYNSKAPLHLAVLHSDSSTLKTLLENENCDVNITDIYGQTALHDATHKNHTISTKLLLEHPDIDINIPDIYGETPIHTATLENIQILLDRPEIDIDTNVDIDGQSSRQKILHKYPQLEEKLHRVQPKFTMEDLSSMLRGNTDDIDTFIKRVKADNRHCRGPRSSTYLQLACELGLANVVDELLQLGANPNELGLDNDKTPMMLAAEKGHHEILLKLLKIPSASFKPINGKTVLHSLFDGMYQNQRLKFSDTKKPDYHKCLEYILKEAPQDKLDLDSPDNRGNTALHYAVDLNDNTAVKMLLDKGAYVCTKNNEGEMPLRSIDPTILEEYLDHSFRDWNGQIYFHYRMLQPLKKHNTSSICHEMEPIRVMADTPNLRQLLRHPIICSFVKMKWYYTSTCFYVSLASYMLFWLLLNSYIFYASNENAVSADSSSKVSGLGSVVLGRLLWSATFLFWVILLAKELFRLYVSFEKYIKSLENLLKITLALATGIFLVASPQCQSVLAPALFLLSFIELVLAIGHQPHLFGQIETLKYAVVHYLKFLLRFSVLMSVSAAIFVILNGHTYDLFIFDVSSIITKSFASSNDPSATFDPPEDAPNPISKLLATLLAISTIAFLCCDLSTTRRDIELDTIVSQLKLVSDIETTVAKIPPTCYKMAATLAYYGFGVPLWLKTYKGHIMISKIYVRFNMISGPTELKAILTSTNKDHRYVQYGANSSIFSGIEYSWEIDSSIIENANQIRRKLDNPNEIVDYEKLIEEYIERLQNFENELINIENILVTHTDELTSLVSYTKSKNIRSKITQFVKTYDN